jgi:hypothetical protein
MFANKTMIPFALVLAAVLGVLVVYLYRTERHMVSRRVGRLLTGLRVALIIILMLMLTEPIISITGTQPRRGVLMVMVDNSRSMQIADRERPGYEKLRLADALGLLPEGLHRSGLVSAREALAELLAGTGAVAQRWSDFAEVMSLGVLEEKERVQRLDETLAGTQKLRNTLAGIVTNLEAAGKASPPLPPAVTLGVDRLRAALAQLNTGIFDEIIREVGGPEFRVRLTVGGLRGVNQLFGRADAQMVQAVAQMREIVVQHDTLLAQARLGALPDVTGAIDRSTRLELAARMLADSHVNFIPGLEGQYTVRAYLFARAVSELPITIGDNGVSAGVRPPAAAAESLYTDLSDGLAKVTAAVEGEDIAGVVVLSDGRFNFGEDPLKLARLLGARGIPLYPVTVGSTVAPTDVAVVKVTGPEVVHEKDVYEADVLVKADGFQGQEMVLTVAEKGKTVAGQKFTVTPGTNRTVVKVRFIPDGKGPHGYVVSVPVQPKEVFTNNNEGRFAVAVLDKKLKILLVDGGPRWEYRYLKNALLRDERLDLTYLLFDPLTTSKEEVKRALAAFPHKKEEVLAYDAVILGDVDPAQLTTDDLANLEAFVNDRGGTLIFIAGRSFMPAAYGRTALGPLLPVIPPDDPKEKAKDLPLDGFPLALTAEAQVLSIFRLSPDEKENLETWAELPKMMWYAPVKEVKPGAVVWAYANLGQTAEAPGTPEAYKRPVVVSQSYGMGRVFYMGTDGTWRWRYKVEDKYFHQFWGQVILWATSGKLPVGTEHVKLGTDKFEYLDGEDIVVRARVLSEKMLPVADAMVTATLLRKGDDAVVAKSTLDCLPESGGHYEGKFLTVPAGSYAVKLTIPGREQELAGLVTELEVKEAPTRELVELSADAAMMEELAARSGGRSFSLDDFGRLSGSLRPMKWSHVTTSEVRLWNHWLLLILFCAMVTVEWGIRKLEGLL